MSAMISLPLFDHGFSNAPFNLLLKEIEVTNPEMVRSWAMLRHIDLHHGVGFALRVDALASALTRIEPTENGSVERILARLAWLKHDMAVAPNSISQPIVVPDSTDLGLDANLALIVLGTHFTWRASPYLLGVLLGELHRNEGLPASTAQEIDQIGFLDVQDPDLDDIYCAVKRTVDSRCWQGLLTRLNQYRGSQARA